MAFNSCSPDCNMPLIEQLKVSEEAVVSIAMPSVCSQSSLTQ